MKKAFEGATQGEVERKADQWWRSQKGLRQIHRSCVATGDAGPSIKDMDRWVVTITYEFENSN
jgi:hypothetical protein